MSVHDEAAIKAEEHKRAMTKAYNDALLSQSACNLSGLVFSFAKHMETICEGGGIKIIVDRSVLAWGYDTRTITYSKADVRQQLDDGLEKVAKFSIAINKLLSRNLFARIMNKMPEGVYIE